MNLFSGLGVAMVTPYTEEGSIDVPALRKLTEHLISGGVDYLVPMGTTGESVTLVPDEFIQAVETVLEVNNGRKPVLMGCGGNATATVVRKMGEFQKRFSLDGFLSVSPYYNKPTQQGIYLHYKALSEASNLPIVMYNVPGRTGSNMEADTTLRLAWDFKNLVAVKEASGNLEQGMDILTNKPDDFIVLSGDDILAFPSICLGYSGVISVIGNALPQAFGRMVHAAMAQDVITARTLHFELKSLMQLLFKEGNPAGVKALLNEMDICQSYVRLPLASASPELRNSLRTALEKIKVPV